MLNAAPGLYASVKRTTSPSTRCGTWRGMSILADDIFVTTSRTTTVAAAVQNTRAFRESEVMPGRLGYFARFADHRRGRSGSERGVDSILLPQHQGQQE